MKNLLLQTIILIYCGIFIFCVSPAVGTAEVILSDDFSAWGKDYLFTTDDYSPPGSGLTLANGGFSATFDNITHYAGEVTTPGREGVTDRSFKVWRNSTFLYNFDGLLEYSEANLHTTRELYTRWYMKIPSDFTLSEGTCNMNYLKMWRYYFDENVGGSNMLPIYLNFNGSSFSNARMQVYGVGDSSGWHTLLSSIADIRDNQWHCHELRIKLNTEGNSDAEIQYWLDGVEKIHATNITLGANNNDYFSRLSFGIGNTGARNCPPTGEFQSTWRAIEYDDYVLSTEYVGTDGSRVVAGSGSGAKLNNAGALVLAHNNAIGYSLPGHSSVLLEIYNHCGELVRTLVNTDKAAGQYTVKWDGLNIHGSKVANGIYLCRMVIEGSQISAARMVYLR